MITLVSSLRLRAGAEPAHRALHDEGVAAAAAMGGLVRHELVPAVEGAQEETVALLTFADRSCLDVWLGSPERSDVLARMESLATHDRSVTVLSGFPGWFRSGSGVPTRWKQAAVVVIGLIPVSLAVTLVRDAVAPGLPLPAVVVVSAVANVSALTWLVMPPLNRLFAGWLTPSA